MRVEIANIAGKISIAKETPQRRMVRQMLNSGNLEPVERDMMGVEINRRDTRGRGLEVAQHIAAARSDRDKMMVGLDLHGSHVHHRVLPDLRIDKAPEGEAENSFQGTFKTQHPVSMNRAANQIAAARCFHDRVECHRESLHERFVKI